MGNYLTLPKSDNSSNNVEYVAYSDTWHFYKDYDLIY